ncbi:hypothetical protein B0H11DRAFT_582374 [Mycena galericulata]|nr:hypothetical protein B0H11DRAFT_582374 [Mycena galericulata]
MAAPSSPFRMSPGSSCSSTLIMTPAPLLPLRGPAPKGHLQPHVTNLPRRRKPPMATTLRISAPPPPSTSSPATADSNYTPTPIQIPALPALPFPISAGGIPQLRGSDAEGIPPPAPRGPVQPAHGNVPRRAKPLTAAQDRARRRREGCIQELGRASGVFVAFDCDWVKDETEFGAVVRILQGSEGNDADVDDKGGGTSFMRLVAPGSRDDGVPCLLPEQLWAACTFISRQRAEGRRVAITTPRAHAADAFSVGICWVSCTAEFTPLGADQDGDAERVHRLVMHWHDLPADEDEDYYSGGLKDEWRGLLSRDGMDYVAAVVAAPIPNSPPPSP